MHQLMTDFWHAGGILTLLDAWQAKDEALNLTVVPPHPLESMPMLAWLKMPAEAHAALCEEWGGFRPPFMRLTGERRAA